MKIQLLCPLILFTISFTVLTGFGFSQDVDDTNLLYAINELNDEKKLEFFRTKLTIEPASGIFGKPTYRNWTAFQGLDKQLNTEEFFSIVGFTEEAPDFSLKTKFPWKLFAYTGIVLGLPNIKPGLSNPVGLIIFSGGAYSLYYYITHPQLTTYELAREIASNYNNKLIEQLKNN